MASLNNQLEATGQFPRIGISLIPLNFTKFADGSYSTEITTFIDYRFKSSVITPVSDFSFTFTNPSSDYFTKYFSEGDIILLFMVVGAQPNQPNTGTRVTLCTGIIDTIETQVSASAEIVTVMGRDLLGQWADQSVFSPFGGKTTLIGTFSPKTLFSLLSQNTRMQPNNFRLQNLSDTGYPIDIQPTDTKLQTLIRYLEPKWSLVWCDPSGVVVMGQPNMVNYGISAGALQAASNSKAPVAGGISGTIIVNKKRGISNCLSIRSTRSSNTIPNFFLPVLTGQTLLANQVATSQGIANPAVGPKRLAALGQIFARAYPIADNSPSLEKVQSLKVTGGVLPTAQKYAAREMARENMREIIVQAIVPGHMNESGNPYQIDQMYMVNFDRDGLEEAMYLYEVEHSLTESDGPRSHLMFTRLNTIVPGNTFQ